MRPDAKELPRVYLSPGDLHIALKPTLIETVLGSCVAVSLQCPLSGKAAMCHAMLPCGPAGEFRYVDAALQHMIEGLQAQGVQPSRLVAKLFGGSDMFVQVRNAGPSRFPVGENNARKAHEILNRYRIQIKSRDTGGSFGRKLLFFTDTGQVYVKLLQRRSAELNLVLPFVDGGKNG